MIRSRARASLTPSDMEFILTTISRDDREERAMAALVPEPEFLDHLLDRPELFRGLTGVPALTGISLSLYFYVMMRHGLLRTGIDNREVADYIATVLTEFAERGRLYRVSQAHDEVFETIVEMLASLEGADGRSRFLIRTHIGNYTLFLLGLFIDHVRGGACSRRTLPGVDYYEDMGRMSYRLASETRQAERLDLAEVLSVLAAEFHPIRKSMNRLAKRYLHLHGANPLAPTGHDSTEESWN